MSNKQLDHNSMAETLEQLISSVPERKIYCSLVNRDNERYNDLPSRKTPDGEYNIIYKILLDRNAQNVNSVIITKELADRMSLDENRLHELAVKNTPELFPPRLEKLEDIFAELKDIVKMEEVGEVIAEINMIRMSPSLQNAFILSNEEGISGAAAMYYEDKKILRDISEKLQKDLFILPSSIHEVIVLPDDGEHQAAELAQTIQKVNMSNEPPEYVLGCQPLHYDKNTNTLAVVKDRDTPGREQSMQKKKELQHNQNYVRRGGR